MLDLKQDPALRRIVDENAALSLALEFVEDGGDANAVRKSVTNVLLDHETPDLSSQIIHVAMARIIDLYCSPPSIAPTTKPTDFEIIARAWLTWVYKGNTLEALRELQPITIGNNLVNGGAINFMVLQPWAFAVEALLLGALPDARRLFRRATDIGSQLGNEANVVIQWTYAATFFEQRRTSAEV